MSRRIPELDELGRGLAAARAAAPGRRRRIRHLSRPALVATLVLGTAVPAVATFDFWVPLVGGETAVPPLAPARTVVASGDSDAGPWRLEAYRARLRDGGAGDCLFVTAGGNGAGACSPPGRRSFVATHSAGPVSFVLAGVPAGTRSVRVRWSDGRMQQAAVRTSAVRGGGRVHFALLQRSGGRSAGPSPASVTLTPPAVSP